jgi:TatD DNase family protein
MPRFFDIGANLTDEQFVGKYRGRRHHQPDLRQVLSRAADVGVERLLITCTDVSDATACSDFIAALPTSPLLVAHTVGIHPTNATRGFANFEGGPTVALARLKDLVTGTHVAAYGEFGLDYDRLHFACKEHQRACFTAQLELVCGLSTPLPLFLHERAAFADFVELISPFLPRLRDSCPGMVVHSFTGTTEERDALLALGFDIGLNGCSLKTAENHEVAAGVPLDRLHLETDAPWCIPKRTHHGFRHVQTHFEAERSDRHAQESEKTVKGRCEPCHIMQVTEIIAAIKQVSVEEVAAAAFSNSMRVFGASS